MLIELQNLGYETPSTQDWTRTLLGFYIFRLTWASGWYKAVHKRFMKYLKQGAIILCLIILCVTGTIFVKLNDSQKMYSFS